MDGMRVALEQSLAEFRGTFGGAIDDFRRGGTEGAALLSGALGSASQDLANAMAAAAVGIREGGEAAGGALQRGGDTASSRLDQAAAGFGGRAEHLARETGGLLAALEALAARIGELERVT